MVKYPAHCMCEKVQFVADLSVEWVVLRFPVRRLHPGKESHEACV